ncbi:MAG: c-type cytochrome [Deltaproteobacteria bacterium]|nr:c-type cytochrome [Deltaproteobacteria bacterium]
MPSPRNAGSFSAAFSLSIATGLVLAACGERANGPGDAATVDSAADLGAVDAGPERDALGPPDLGNPDSGPVELAANAGESSYAIVGEEVTLDGSGSTGAVAYRWDYGNGERQSAPSDDPVARVVYTSAGRFAATLTVLDEADRTRTDTVVVTVTEPLVWRPRQSSTVSVARDRRTAAVVVPDADLVALVDWDEDGSFRVSRRIAVSAGPRTVAIADDGTVFVACQRAGTLDVTSLDGAPTRSIALGRGTRPFGVVATSGGGFAAALGGTGELVIGDGGGVTARWPDLPDARGVAELPDGRIAVTRWRSTDDGATLTVVDPDRPDARESWSLAVDPQAGSDTEIGGVPSYLHQLLVSPDGMRAFVPSLQAATGEGLFRSGRPMTFETTVRAVVSRIDLRTGVEDFEARKQLDNHGFASAGVLSSHGDFLFVALRGTRAVERIDTFDGSSSGNLQNVGWAVEGVALSADDRFLLVDASLSRELVVYDVRDLSDLPEPVARLPTVESEPLSADVLMGKRLFNDSLDPRLSRDGYIACAHCHLDGETDNRVWDFTDRGEGLRNTISLLGRAGAGDGPIHWSGNFDEIQDFEHDIRNAFRGLGLMADADFHTGSRDSTLGDPKAGVSADLDALAAYVASLDEDPESPHRTAGGELSESAARGRSLFESAAVGCASCHAGARLTDSRFVASGMPLLHDVGTLGPGSGMRLGATLSGIDTPTLHDLWLTAPYLHDGSAATLEDVLTTRNPDDLHGTTSGLTAEQIADLVAYLLSL